MKRMSRPVFPQLDTVRAIASVAVVATHTAFWAGVYPRGTFGAATQRLEVGVAIFFVLSGFLLGLPFVQRAVRDTPVDPIGRYALKRALRILPVYWLSVVAAWTLLEDNRDLSLARFVQNLLLVDIYRSPQLPEGLSQMWSLSVEVAFYAVLPLLGLLMHRAARGSRRPVGRVLLVVLVLCTVSVAWVATVYSTPASWADWAARWLPAYLSWFALGLGVAATWVAQPGESRVADLVRTVGRDRLACWTGAAALFVLVSTPLGGSALLVEPSTLAALARHVLYALVAVLLVLPCVHQGQDVGARVLSHPFPRHLGHLSYSIFCVHMIVLYLAAQWWGFDLFRSSWPTLFAVVLGVSLVVSEVLYRVVERPMLRLAHRRSKPGARTAQITHPSENAPAS